MDVAEVSGKILHGRWGVAAKPCDSCDSAAALVFCRVDSAFFCAACDERAHAGGGGHERVWMCEVCEQAPAAVTCKADAAALCVTCDRDIHSANPLARRHDRLPVASFFEPAACFLKSSPTSAGASTVSFLVPSCIANPDAVVEDEVHNKAMDEEEAASWILPNPNPSNPNGCPNHKFVDATADQDIKPSELFFGDNDPFLDFDYAGPMDHLVPVQSRGLTPPQLLSHHHRPSETCFELDFARSKLSPYSYAAQSLSQSVSSDVGVVPDGNSTSDVSYPFAGKPIGSGGDLSSVAAAAAAATVASQATQLSGTEREARVLRYREKRKNRKFEKTIRYASRKAYAETRPRIKGRFAKRTELEADVDACFFASAAPSTFELADPGYGVVPSF